MIVDDFNIMSVSASPAKADTPLVVDADRMLSSPFS
jgi:hypothetical protein